MSCRITYPREVLQRVSDRKKRKLAIEENNDIIQDSQLEVVEDSESSLKGYRDLFGEIIPCSTNVNNLESNNISSTKTPNSKRKRRQPEEFVISPIKIPKKVFYPTPKIINIMKEAQLELYTLMGLNKSSSDISVVSSDMLNVSGIHNLLDSPKPKTQNEFNINVINNEDKQNPSQILESK